MVNYKDIIYEIIETEGGLVDNPHDLGGITKYGVTIKSLSTYWGRQATREDIINLDKRTAFNVFEKLYYRNPKIDKFKDDFIQYIVLDMAVNHGSSNAVRMLQETINNTKLFNPIKVDGLIGPQTIKRTNNCYCLMARYFTNMLCDRRERFYRNIVKHNSSQQVFLNGWLNRNNKFRTELP